VLESGAQCFGLPDVAGKSIENEPAARVLLSKPLRDQLQHEFVGHQLSAIHIAGGLAAKLGVFAHNGPQ